MADLASRLRRWRLLAARGAGALLLLAGSPRAAAQQPPTPAYQVKAVFLYHFTSFAEWPAEAFADEQAPLAICLLGDDPFGAYLDETVHGETVEGRSIVVRRHRWLSELDACHVLFVSASEAARMEAVLQALHGRSILTVGDAEHFVQAGGMIQFFTERGKIRLRINVAALREADVKLSAKLLRLADIHEAEGG